MALHGIAVCRMQAQNFAAISAFTQLQSVDLSHNKLTELSCFTNLTSLIHLCVSHNSLAGEHTRRTLCPAQIMQSKRIPPLVVSVHADLILYVRGAVPRRAFCDDEDAAVHYEP